MQLYLFFYIIPPIVGMIYLAIRKNNKNSVLYVLLSITMFIIYLLFISLRPAHIGTDTKNYITFYTLITSADLTTLFQYRFEPLFSLLSYVFLIFDSHKVYIAALALLHVLLLTLGGMKWFRGENLFIYTLISLSVFTTYNLGVNILRQGIAIPLALLSIYYLNNNKLTKFSLFSVLCVMFHYTSSLMILFALLSRIRIKINYLISSWLLAVLMLYSNVLSKFVENLKTLFVGYSSYQDILSERSLELYRIGFRADFILYSAIPIFLYILIDRKKISQNSMYLIRLYLMLNTTFVLFMVMPYSDRIGIYSWSLFPVIITSFLGESKLKLLNDKSVISFGIIVFGILGLTLYPLMIISTLLW